jgi:single-strand DNA-binding protein
VAHGPTHNLAREHIQHGCQVQPALSGRDAGEIRYLFLVGTVSGEILVQNVGRNGQLRVGARGLFVALALDRPQPILAHQTGNAMTTTNNALLTQLMIDPATAIRPSNFVVHGANVQQVASFSVAVSRKNRAGDKQTVWVRVNCWSKLADVAVRYVRKGSLVQVTAEWLRPSAWMDQTGTPQPSLDIDAQRLVLLDRAENGDNGHSESGEDIPF